MAVVVLIGSWEEGRAINVVGQVERSREREGCGFQYGN